MVAVLAVGVAGGCSGGDSKDDPGRKTGPPQEITMGSVVGTVPSAPLLHWKGSWKAADQTLTLDLRAMGDGDAVGTVANGGGAAQVVVVDRENVLLKGGRGYWRHRVDRSATARFADRWIDANGAVGGAGPGDLAPRVLGQALRELGSALHSPPAEPSGSPRAVPSGVPSGALRFEVGSSAMSPSEHTFWVSPTSPRQLVGYTGTRFPGKLFGPPDEESTRDVTLTVRAGDASEAKAAYMQMADHVQTAPKTLDLDANDLDDFKVSTDIARDTCRSGACRVEVAGGDDVEGRKPTIRAVVRVTLYGDGGEGSKEAGTCTIRMPTAAPGKTVKDSCTITDARIQRIWDSAEKLCTLRSPTCLKHTQWSADAIVTSIREQRSLNPAQLAAKLRERANGV
ncbi:hypothetical protein [Actinomadura rubrisoli]|uniref:Uncharacterized protein n=1 Tax=Actinomadura rubrisoli TaxID=2530368 RepID=A0A4V2YSQ6_9ACTN|nr:hypothetical protein [Actinomadura rubrisoli]TDD70837.1 hypothetical protein E1298_36375 [Actinomadura rubrisoli]